jgi:hypothetical protein
MYLYSLQIKGDSKKSCTVQIAILDSHGSRYEKKKFFVIRCRNRIKFESLYKSVCFQYLQMRRERYVISEMLYCPEF